MSNEDKFWGDDPNVLFSTFHFFPLQQMTLNEKINAFTRSIICISLIIQEIIITEKRILMNVKI